MRFFCALLGAAAIHLALGALFVLCLDRGADLEESARLDVSAIELSLTEIENDSAKPVVSTPPVEVRKLPADENFKSPAPDKSSMDMPSDPPVIEPLAIPGAEMPAPPKMDIPEAARPLAKKSETEEKPESSRPDKTESNPEISAPVQARVDVMPKLRRSIKPKYPKVSRERGEEGRIRLRLEINAKGLVEGVEIIASTGFKLLDDAAVKAVRSAEFIPARLAGEPVFSKAEISLEFKLN